MECIAKMKVRNVKRVEKEQKMAKVSMKILKRVTFLRAKTDETKSAFHLHGRRGIMKNGLLVQARALLIFFRNQRCITA